MEHQPFIYLILGVLLVGVAVSGGYFMFSYHSMASNKDAIINDLYTLSGHARHFASKPATFGGGGGKFAGFQITPRFSINQNATYSVIGLRNSVAERNVWRDTLRISAVSSHDYGTITLVLEEGSQAPSFLFTGEFQ